MNLIYLSNSIEILNLETTRAYQIKLESDLKLSSKQI